MTDPSNFVELEPHEHDELVKGSNRATASMLLGIFGIFFVPLALIGAPLGHSAWNKFRKFPEHAAHFGKGNATAGLVISWLVIIFWTITLIRILG